MVISKLDYPLCHISFMLEKQTDQRRSAKVGGPCSPRDRLHFHCRMFNDSGGGGSEYSDRMGWAQVGCKEERDLCECW